MLPGTACHVSCSVFGLDIHLFCVLGSINSQAFLVYSYNHLVVVLFYMFVCPCVFYMLVVDVYFLYGEHQKDIEVSLVQMTQRKAVQVTI